MNLLIDILLYLILVSLTVLAHEYGHFLAFKHYGGTPILRFRIKKLSITPYVTPIEGEEFFIKLFRENPNQAWKKQIVLSGAGLFQTLVYSIVFLYIGLSYDLDMFWATGLINLLLFLTNIKPKYSDGRRIYEAIKYRKSYISFLEKELVGDIH